MSQHLLEHLTVLPCIHLYNWGMYSTLDLYVVIDIHHMIVLYTTSKQDMQHSNLIQFFQANICTPSNTTQQDPWCILTKSLLQYYSHTVGEVTLQK